MHLVQKLQGCFFCCGPLLDAGTGYVETTPDSAKGPWFGWTPKPSLRGLLGSAGVLFGLVELHEQALVESLGPLQAPSVRGAKSSH